MDIVLPETSGPFILGVEVQNKPVFAPRGLKNRGLRGKTAPFCTSGARRLFLAEGRKVISAG